METSNSRLKERKLFRSCKPAESIPSILGFTGTWVKAPYKVLRFLQQALRLNLIFELLALSQTELSHQLLG